MKNIFIVLSIALLTFSCSRDPQQVRGYNIFRDMAYPVAYQAYSENEFTPSGKTMLPPVEGTIARGRMPHLYGTSEEEAIRAGEELFDPYETTMESIRRGEFLYQNYCQVCHGEGLEGDGPITRRGFPPPPSLVFGRAMDFSKGRLYHVITAGYGDMVGYAPMMNERDRWFLAQYIKFMQEQQ